MAAFFADLRLAVRKLWRHPRSAAVVVLTLGLGLGATTAVVGVLYKVLLEPLPYADPGSLVAVEAIHRERGIEHGRASIGDFVDWRSQVRSLTLETSGHFSAVITEGGDPEDVPGAVVSTGFFTTLGVHPLLGRAFRADEEIPGNDQVVLLSHAFWQRRFGADPAIVGRPIRLSGDPYEIVGVLPPDFWWNGPEIALWSPMALGPQHIQRQRRGMYLIGRLQPGASPAEAEAELQALSTRSAELYPDTNGGWSARVVPLARQWTRKVRPILLLLLAAALVVLTIAGANVVSVLLARSAAQDREAAIRSALGGGNGSLLRQQALEVVVLALAGGACGLLWAHWGSEALVALAPKRIPRLDEVALGPATVAFALALSLAVGLLLAGINLLRVRRTNLRDALLQGDGRSSGGRYRARFGEALIIAEVACALPLTLGAGLLARSLAEVGAIDPGFHSQDVVVADVFLPPARYPEDAQQAAFFRRLIDRLTTSPGVRGAAATAAMPMHAPALLFERPYRLAEALPTEQQPLAAIRIVSPGFFRTLGATLLTGRDFGWRDDAEAPRVVIVNQTLARAAWPHLAASGRPGPEGQRLVLDYRGEHEVEVVGVASDLRYDRLESPPVPEIYLASPQYPVFFSSLAVRGEGNPETLTSRVENAVWEIDPEQTLSLSRLSDIVDRTTRHRRFTIAMLAAFAALALIL
ncbi:MAG: ADOP family duplicated permease, partial [Acidobacteriota bacterium]